MSTILILILPNQRDREAGEHSTGEKSKIQSLINFFSSIYKHILAATLIFKPQKGNFV